VGAGTAASNAGAARNPAALGGLGRSGTSTIALRPQRRDRGDTAMIPKGTFAIGPAPRDELADEGRDGDETFLAWIRPFLEIALLVNRRFRAVGDQDQALLYLGAWHFLMSDVAQRRDLVTGIGGLPMREGLARLCPAEFPASHMAAIVEETGIPRETARRKLAGLVRDGIVVVLPDGAVRLAQPRDDILELAEPSFALARWILASRGWPPDALGEPRSLLSFLSLARHYLAVYLSLLKSRRRLTGTVSHVPLQLGLSLLNVLRVEDLLAREGPPAALDFEAFVPLSRRVFDLPIYLRPLTEITGLSLAELRAACRRLADSSGFITLVGTEALKLGGPNYGPESVGDRRFYPEETRRALQAFTLRATARAARLAG